jgi:hypothetical protein
MQIINLTLFVLLLAVQCFYAIAWNNITDSIITASLVRVLIELFVKIVLLCLVIQFGSSVIVKSFVHQNGDLIIVGTDDQNK